MTVSEFVGALRRQWVWLLVGLLLTGGFTAAAYLLTKPTYQMTGNVLLLPPAASVPEGGNPYLQLGGLRQAVDLLGVALSDQSTRQEVEAVSDDADYSVRADTLTTSPILVIDVKDSSREGATRIRDLLVTRVPVRLEALQQAAGVVPEYSVTSTVLTQDVEAEEVGRDRLRSGLVAAAVGIVLTLLVVARRDARASRRPTRVGEPRPGRLRRHPARTPDDEPVDVGGSRGVTAPL